MGKLQEENMDTLDLAVAAERIQQTQGNWLSVLDALRGGAALYVVCNHATALLTLPFADARAFHSLPLELLAGVMHVFAFGHQAVVLFFVLSGFCIHFRQAQALHTRPATEVYAQFQVRTYFARRWWRIVPPFYFSLIFTMFVDWITRLIYPAFLYHLTSNRIANQILAQNNTISAFVGNIFFLQTLACSTFGNNTPLWSLAYEFFLYALYPTFLKLRCTVGKRKSLIIIGILSTLAAICINTFPQNPFFLLPVLAYWLSWVFGAFAAEAHIGRQLLPKLLGNIYILGFMGILWLTTVRILPPILSDTFGAALCSLLVLRMLSRIYMPPEAFSNGNMIRAMMRVGAFSYSLYLTHVPVLGLICTAWFTTHHTFPTNPLLFLVGVCISVAVGWFTSRLSSADLCLGVKIVKIALTHVDLPNQSKGGVANQVHHFANVLTERGHEVTMFTFSPAYEECCYKVHQYASRSALKTVQSYLFALKLAHTDFSRFDILHTNGDNYLLRGRHPQVRTFYGSARDEAQTAVSLRRRLHQRAIAQLEEVSTKAADINVGISEATRKRLPAISTIIPCGVDLSHFCPGPKALCPTILFVGTAGGRKRGTFLADVFQREIRSHFPDSQLWTVADKPLEGAGITNYGRVSLSTLTMLYQQAWVFCLPSTYEGFGVPYIEAMASGTPVVASPNPGAGEVLCSGQYGIIAEDAHLGEQITRLLGSYENREHYVTLELARASNFAWARVADQYETLYAKLCGKDIHL